MCSAARCYARQCYGSLREFTLITTDNDDNRLLYLQRPARCSSRCFYACCCLQEMNIIIPPKDTLGVMKEKYVHTMFNLTCLSMIIIFLVFRFFNVRLDAFRCTQLLLWLQIYENIFRYMLVH